MGSQALHNTVQREWCGTRTFGGSRVTRAHPGSPHTHSLTYQEKNWRKTTGRSPAEGFDQQIYKHVVIVCTSTNRRISLHGTE